MDFLYYRNIARLFEHGFISTVNITQETYHHLIENNITNATFHHLNMTECSMEKELDQVVIAFDYFIL